MSTDASEPRSGEVVSGEAGGGETSARASETPELVVRPAREADREAVFAFCARTWEDGDYIPEVWEAWLGDARGTLLVGTLSEHPVALAHVRMVGEDEAWIEGVRVDPTLRRQGIGRVLISRMLVAARERGATVARLFTDSDNLASQGLFTRFGFTRVAELVGYRGALLPTGEHAELASLTRPTEDDFERIWAWLEQSTLAPFNGGLEIVRWMARAVTEPRLRRYLAEGRVVTVEAYEMIQALAIAVPEELEVAEQPTLLMVRYCDGLADGIGRLAQALRREAAERSLGGVRLWLPDQLILRDAMDGAGYERRSDHTMLIYAREL
jgi:ribosomal protein S18 acetylase RimI-like enzyme